MLPPLYAHRLGRAYGPDSSAAALRGALAAGVDGLETDVCLTADGALVLLHDPYLPLGTDLEGFAHERTARELPRPAAGPGGTRDGGGAAVRRGPAGGGAARGRPAARGQGARRPGARRASAEALAERLRGRAWRSGSRCCRSGRRRARERRGWAAPRGSSSGPTTPRRRWCAGRAGTASAGCAWSTSCSPAAHRALRRGGLSVTTGTLNEPALLDRILPLRPDAVTSDRPHALREAAPAAAGGLIRRPAARAWRGCAGARRSSASRRS